MSAHEFQHLTFRLVVSSSSRHVQTTCSICDAAIHQRDTRPAVGQGDLRTTRSVQHMKPAGRPLGGPVAAGGVPPLLRGARKDGDGQSAGQAPLAPANPISLYTRAQIGAHRAPEMPMFSTRAQPLRARTPRRLSQLARTVDGGCGAWCGFCWRRRFVAALSMVAVSWLFRFFRCPRGAATASKRAASGRPRKISEISSPRCRSVAVAQGPPKKSASKTQRAKGTSMSTRLHVAFENGFGSQGPRRWPGGWGGCGPKCGARAGIPFRNRRCPTWDWRHRRQFRWRNRCWGGGRARRALGIGFGAQGGAGGTDVRQTPSLGCVCVGATLRSTLAPDFGPHPGDPPNRSPTASGSWGRARSQLARVWGAGRNTVDRSKSRCDKKIHCQGPNESYPKSQLDPIPPHRIPPHSLAKSLSTCPLQRMASSDSSRRAIPVTPFLVDFGARNNPPGANFDQNPCNRKGAPPRVRICNPSQWARAEVSAPEGGRVGVPEGASPRDDRPPPWQSIPLSWQRSASRVDPGTRVSEATHPRVPTSHRRRRRASPPCARRPKRGIAPARTPARTRGQSC